MVVLNVFPFYIKISILGLLKQEKGLYRCFFITYLLLVGQGKCQTMHQSFNVIILTEFHVHKTIRLECLCTSTEYNIVIIVTAYNNFILSLFTAFAKN